MKRSNIIKVFLATNVALSLGLLNGTAWGRCSKIEYDGSCGTGGREAYVKNTCDNRAVKATVRKCAREGNARICRYPVVEVAPGSRYPLGCSEVAFIYYKFKITGEE